MWGKRRGCPKLGSVCENRTYVHKKDSNCDKYCGKIKRPCKKKTIQERVAICDSVSRKGLSKVTFELIPEESEVHQAMRRNYVPARGKSMCKV